MTYLVMTDPTSGKSVREGAREGEFKVDGEIDDTGFDGIEELNWEEIETIIPQ
jgi:hypothetical protein